MPYSRPEPISGEHQCSGFDCGEPSLTSWLVRHARQADASGSARVYVTAERSRVVGYYALAAAPVRPAEATERLPRGHPARRAIPVVLLARLAVDLDYQGRRVGRSLLQDALLRTNAAAEEIGIRAILVHALGNRARDWYGRFGFEPSPSDPLHLMLLIKDLRRFLASIEP